MSPSPPAADAARGIRRRIRIRVPAALWIPVVVVVGLALGYGFYLGPHRADAQRNSRRAAICNIADVVVDTGKYPRLAEFLPVEWRYVRGAAVGTGDTALANLARTLPGEPDPVAMRRVAAYCHGHGLGVVLRSS